MESVARAVDAAASVGFGSDYNVDLIFGAKGETLADWATILEEVVTLVPAPTHVSAYSLTVEAGTPLARDLARHPDPDDQADKYLLADSVLEAAGYAWYEISNWAKPGSECRHNQLYWAQGEYLGVGCAAHSHGVDLSSGSARRWWNVRTPDRFIRLTSEGSSVEAAGEVLDPRRRRLERLELELRTRHGVPEESLPAWRDNPDLAGLVQPVSPGRVALTPQGRFLANEVALRLAP
jgi:oxygen-independent coproporphyrinogen-3 oxidase